MKERIRTGIWKIMVLITLGALSIKDIKEKEISIAGPLVLLILGIIDVILGGNISVQNLWGILPGIICYIIAVITKEQIGKGDALVLIALGPLLGVNQMLLLLMIAAFFSALAGVVLITFFQKGRNYTIAFVPFILVGYIGVI